MSQGNREIEEDILDSNQEVKKAKVRRFAGDLLVEDTYLSKDAKDSGVNRRTINRKMLKAFINGQDYFMYRGEQYPVLYTIEEVDE